MKKQSINRSVKKIILACLLFSLFVSIFFSVAKRTVAMAESDNLATQTNLTVSDWGTVSIPLVASLEANTTYEWSFKFSLAGGTQIATVTIAGTEVFSGTGFNTNTVKKGEFTTGDTAPTDTSIIFKSSGGGNFSISDLTVKKAGTETEEPTVIENYATQTSCSVSDWGTVSIPLAASLEANATYRWSFKFSLAGGTQIATVTIAGTEVFSDTGFNTNTVKKGEFTTGDTAPTDKNIVFKSDGGGNFNISDLVIIKIDYTAPVVTDYHTGKSFLERNSDNIFVNGSFESTLAAGTGWNVSGFSDKESFSIDTTEKYSGSKSLKFTGMAGETELILKLSAEEQTEYTFGAWVKGGYLSTQYPGSVKFGIVDNYGNFADFSADANTHTSNESSFTSFARDMKWHRIGFNFKTGNSQEIVFVIRGKNALMWFDDVVVSKTANCIEMGSASLTAPKKTLIQYIPKPICDSADNLIKEISITNAEFWLDTNICRSAVRVCTDPRDSSNEVLLYEPSEYNVSNSYYSRTISVNKDTDYIFSAFYRADVSSDAKFGLYYKTGWQSSVLYEVECSNVGRWNFVKYKFNSNDYDKITLFIQDKGGNLLLDEIRLFEKDDGISFNKTAKLNEMNSALSMLTTSAPSNNVVISNYASKQSYNINGWAADSSELTAKLEANTDYVWSFKVWNSSSDSNMKFTVGGVTVYCGKASEGLKSGLLKTGINAPQGTFIQFSTPDGGDYNISDLELMKLRKGAIECNTTVSDSSDLVYLREILLGTAEIRSEYSPDLNSDSKIDLIDLILLKKTSANK